MKRYILILIASLALAWNADAQISIKKSDVGNAAQLTTLAMAWSWLYQSGDSYFIVMKSDNRFDDDYWLHIGETKEECVESVASLLDLADTIGEADRFDVDNGAGKTFSVTQYKSMGIKGLRFQGDNYAGTAYILPSGLNKALKWIQNNLK